MGRPSKLDATARVKDGKAQTVADRIVELMATGAYVERAAAEVGIHKDTLYEWLRVANQARIGQAMGRSLSPHERRCLAFSDAVEQAEASYELAALGALERIGRGGYVRRVSTVVERTEVLNVPQPDGSVLTTEVVVERTRTTREEPAPGNVAALVWKLRHRFPERYSEKLVVEQVQAGDPDPAAKARAVADEVAAYLTGVADATPAAADPD